MGIRLMGMSFHENFNTKRMSVYIMNCKTLMGIVFSSTDYIVLVWHSTFFSGVEEAANIFSTSNILHPL